LSLSGKSRKKKSQNPNTGGVHSKDRWTGHTPPGAITAQKSSKPPVMDVLADLTVLWLRSLSVLKKKRESFGKSSDRVDDKVKTADYYAGRETGKVIALYC